MGIGFGYKNFWVLGMSFGFGYKIFWVLGLGIKFFGYWVLGLGIYTQPKPNSVFSISYLELKINQTYAPNKTQRFKSGFGFSIC
jgi:hypothetical protein